MTLADKIMMVITMIVFIGLYAYVELGKEARFRRSVVGMACYRPPTDFLTNMGGLPSKGLKWECLDIKDKSWLNQQKITMLVKIMGGVDGKLPDPESPRWAFSLGVQELRLGDHYPKFARYVQVTVKYESHRSEPYDSSYTKLFNVDAKEEVSLTKLIRKDKLDKINNRVRRDFVIFFKKYAGVFWGVPKDEQAILKWQNKELPELLNRPELRLNNLGQVTLSYCIDGGNVHSLRHCSHFPAEDHLDFKIN